MKLTPWFNRTFPTITDAGQLPSIIERLAGTPLRLEEKVLQFSDEFLVKFQMMPSIMSNLLKIS